jgi:hypothetical protein
MAKGPADRPLSRRERLALVMVAGAGALVALRVLPVEALAGVSGFAVVPASKR